MPDDDFTAKVFYVALPDDLNNDSDIPFNGYLRLSGFHYLIVLYSAYYINQYIEGKPNAQVMYAQYLSEVKEMEKSINKTLNYLKSFGGRRE